MRSLKVLLLENVAAQAAAARNALSGAGYQLLISRFEANGLKRAREWKPDVIVLANTYTKGALADFCRSLKEAAGRPVRLVLASSLTLERLSEDEPDLKSIADGFVLRPYSPVSLKEALDNLTGKSAPADGAVADEGRGRLGGKGVLVLDRDPEVLRVLREHLAPRGVRVDAPHWERAADYCRAHNPQAVVLEWPTPAGFTIETLREIREAGQGGAASVLLLSRAGQEVVRNQSPAMLNQASMLFTKPISWGPFFRYLAGILKHAPAAPAAKAAPSSNPGGEGLEGRFQKEMEAKFLEVEELKKRLHVAEVEGGYGVESGEVAKIREENVRLRAQIDEGRKQTAVDLGKMQLREAELEVKLNNIIRKKSDSEKRAQDLIDAGAAGVEQAKQKIEEAHGELQVRMEEVAALRSDLEQALVQKEQAEEKLQGSRGASEKAREEHGAAQAALLADLEEARAGLDELRRGEAERARLAEEETKECERLRRELAEIREQSTLRELKLTALQEEVDSLEEARLKEEKEPDPAVAERLGELEGELEEKVRALSALSETVKEKDGAVAELREKLRESDGAVAGLDEELAGWRHRWAESEAQLADLAAREAKLARECEKLRASEEPERIASLEALVEEKEEKLRGVEGKNVVTGAFASELETKLLEQADNLEKLEEGLRGERERADGLEKRLRERDELVRSLEEGREESGEEARRRQKDLGEREEELSSLREQLRERDELVRSLEEGREESGEEARRRQKDLGEREEELSSLREQLRERDELVRSLEESREESGEEARRRQKDLGEREEELSSLREQLRERDELVRSLEEGREESGEEARRRQKDLGEREEELSSLREQLRELREKGEKEERSREATAEEHRLAMGGAEEKRTALEEELRLARDMVAEAEGGGGEFEKVQNLLQEVIARAQSEVIERTRKEIELQERLKASVEEKKFLLTRLEREVGEAGEREKRLTALLDNALKGTADMFSSHSGKGQGNLPVIVSPPPSKPNRLMPAVAAVLALFLLAGAGWLSLRNRGPREPTAGAPPGGERRLSEAIPENERTVADPVASQREVWEDWTRSDVSGGVLLQATLRSKDEIAAEVETEQRTQGWSDEQAARELDRLLGPYRFEENFYLYLYLKNLQPGYPSYVDDIYSHLTLRDDRGNEAAAFLPPDMEKHRRVYSFTAGELSKSRSDLVYEITIPVAFSRRSLAARPGYIQLLAYNIGASSRRVLTWELE